MYAASLFAAEKKVTITEVSNILNNALTTCFTVCFNAKPDKKEIIKNIQQNGIADAKQIADSILCGKQSTIVGKLASSETKLGRS